MSEHIDLRFTDDMVFKAEDFAIRKHGNYLQAVKKDSGQIFASYNILKDRFGGVCAVFQFIRDSPKFAQAKIDISDADHPVRSLVADLIDEVEAKIRSAHPAVDKIASNWKNEDKEKPNTLLYGENYYDLEESIVSQIVELLEKNYGIKV